MTGQPANEIFAEAPDRFFLRVIDAHIVFNRDAAGKVTGLVVYHGDREMPATKQ